MQLNILLSYLMKQMACRRNIVAFLDTGAGKTFISVLLIKEIGAKEREREKKMQGSRKIIFFLVPKKVLVGQQGQVIRTHSDLEVSRHRGGLCCVNLETKPLTNEDLSFLEVSMCMQVGEYCSDGGYYDDTWDSRMWSRELAKREVFVMTPQVLWNMLQHGFVRMGKIALICFDECHHARKNHPYNRIMQVWSLTLCSRTGSICKCCLPWI